MPRSQICWAISLVYKQFFNKLYGFLIGIIKQLYSTKYIKTFDRVSSQVFWKRHQSGSNTAQSFVTSSKYKNVQRFLINCHFSVIQLENTWFNIYDLLIILIPVMSFD